VPDVHFLPDDVTVAVPAGTTILRAAIGAGLPHAHACGGRARCSTCRVVVEDGLERCEPRNDREQTIAERLGCGPEIRLACQTGVAADLTVRRLVLDPEDLEFTDMRRRHGPRRVGVEQEIAVLFADIRGFTSFAERHLPYDVIHVLRRLFRDMSAVVADCGGSVTSFMGDGFMALFGIDEHENPAEQAVQAGLGILDVADAAGPWLDDLVGEALVINVGIHHGEAVIGTIRSGGSDEVVTAIGDTVNVASRIETANKITGTRLLVSDETRARAGASVEVGRSFEVELAGKLGMHTVWEVLGCSAPPPVRPRTRRRAARRGRGRDPRFDEPIALGCGALLLLALAILIVVVFVR
jgi:adenylate cyclase